MVDPVSTDTAQLQAQINSARFTISEQNDQIRVLKLALDKRDSEIAMLKDMLKDFKPMVAQLHTRIARWV